MSNIDKRALREAAERAESDSWGYDRDEFNEALTASTVLALLDELVAAGIITKVGGGRDMKIGDHMQEVVGLVNDLTGYETESALKLLALVVGEYMINADATEVNINAGVMSIKVEITVPGEE